MFRKLAICAVLVALFNSVSCNTTCGLQLQEKMTSAIFNACDTILSDSIEALSAYVSMSKLFHQTMNGPPEKVDSEDNISQFAMWDINNWRSSEGVDLYVGWEDNAYVGYFSSSLGPRLGFVSSCPPENCTMDLYSGVGRDGRSSSTSTTTSYTATKRPWYIAGKDSCSLDNNNFVDCQLINTPLYADFFTGALYLTPALGLANFQGNPLFRFNEDVYPYGLQGQSGTQKSGIAGVAAVDISCSDFADILEAEVALGSGSVAFMMEDVTWNLVAVSDGTPITFKGENGNLNRMQARTSQSPLIADVSDYIISNKYLSDNTIVWNGNIITVRKYFKNLLTWYIVVVSIYDSSVACDIKAEKIALNDVSHSLNQVLGQVVGASRMIQGGVTYNLYPNPLKSPRKADLWKLGSNTTNVQNMLIATLSTFNKFTGAYIGYADGTFVGYALEIDGSFKKFLYQEKSSPWKNVYYTDPNTGYVANPDYVNPSSNSSYDCRSRPWYLDALAAGKGVWSAPYVYDASSNYAIGLTYSVPFYDPQNNNLIGVIGVDWSFDTANAFLENFGGSGVVYYAYETVLSPLTTSSKMSPEYNMLMSSSGAACINAAGTQQVKAWNSEGVNDYFVSTSAMYAKDKSFVYDGSFTTGPLQCEVLNYQSYGLFWRLVGASYLYPTGTTGATGATGGDSASDGQGQDSQQAAAVAADTVGTDVVASVLNSNMHIITAVLVIAVFQMMVSLYIANQSYYSGADKAVDTDTSITDPKTTDSTA